MKKIALIFILFSSMAFASDFEINFGGSVGYSVEFTYIKRRYSALVGLSRWS